MRKIRRSSERGHANHGWLDTYHTFSFADYMDPQHMNFRVLRVINEDYIEGGAGFPTHGHRDMEIITYIVDGALEHKDSLGNGTIIRPGEVQRMTAGTGVRHSEYNHLTDQRTHLLQIWIMPDQQNLPPSYEQKDFAAEMERGELILVASPNGKDGSVTVHQNVNLFAGRLKSGYDRSYEIAPGRHMWLQIVRGELRVDKDTLSAGDGLAVSDERNLKLMATQDTEILLFDLP